MTDEKKTTEETAHDAEVVRLTAKRDAAATGTLAHANRQYQLDVCTAEGDEDEVGDAQDRHAEALEELREAAEAEAEEAAEAEAEEDE